MASTEFSKLKLSRSPNRPAEWKVGKRLGEGASAVVHELLTIGGESTGFAIKAVPLPKKTTRKKSSPAECNMLLLHGEYMIYQHQLQDLQGTIIPSLPSFDFGLKPFVESDRGFRYLVIEMMDSPLWDVVPALLASKKTSVGSVAIRLLECVKAIHERRHVVVDIKPENFMLVKSKKADLASRIRILDLGLAEPVAGMHGHRPNDGIGSLVGTPLYASLAVHQGNTPSRRDDIESLGLVIGELAIRLYANANGLVDSYEKGKSMPSYLPWSHEKSEQDIGEVKEQQSTDKNSDFYKRMGSQKNAGIIFAFLEQARACSYKKTPAYDALETLLSNLEVPSKTTAAKAASKKKTSSRAASAKAPDTKRSAAPRAGSRRTRSQAKLEDSDDDEESPNKIRRGSGMEEDDSISISSSSEEGSSEEKADESMDWDPIPDENDPVPAGKPKARSGLKLVVEEGPHEGETFYLVKGSTDSVILGSNPTNRRGDSVFALSRDDTVSAEHTRIELTVTNKSTVSLKVFDLRSGEDIFVKTHKVKHGGSAQAFANDSITLGASVLRVARMKASDWEKIAAVNPPTGKTSLKPLDNAVAGRATRSRNSVVLGSPPKDIRGINVVITQGPHENESFVLAEGINTTVVVGFNPEVKSPGQETFALPEDKDAADSHARLELSVSKNYLSVKVFDLRSKPTSVNSKKIRKGGSTMAFVGGSIQIGSSVLEVCEMKKEDWQKVCEKSEPMAVDPLAEGDEKPAAVDSNAATSGKKTRQKAAKEPSNAVGIRLDVTGGPYEGETYTLEQGPTETLILGSKPSKRRQESVVSMDQDAAMDENHARFDLVVTSASVAVQVTDLKSKSGTFLNGKQVKKKVAFTNERVLVGETELTIRRI